jgi:hypothetical protein
MTTTEAQHILPVPFHKFQRITTAGGVRSDGLFSNAQVGRDGGRLGMELLPSALVQANNIQDVADVRLCPNQHFEHLRQDPMLDDSGVFV